MLIEFVDNKEAKEEEEEVGKKFFWIEKSHNFCWGCAV